MQLNFYSVSKQSSLILNNPFMNIFQMGKSNWDFYQIYSAAMIILLYVYVYIHKNTYMQNICIYKPVFYKKVMKY